MEINPTPVTPNSSSKTWLPGFGLFPGLPKLEVIFLAVELAIFLGMALVFAHFYTHFTELIDERTASGLIDNPSLILASPTQVSVGQAATPTALAQRLRSALYCEGEAGSDVGTYKISADRLEVHPGTASFFRRQQIWEGAAELKFHHGHIASIYSLNDKSSLQNYWLEPEVITSMFGDARAKRRLVRYEDLPKVVVDAILATEDHRFFSHHGVNFVRIVGAAVADLQADQPRQGGSTLTMQLARNIFLTPRRTIRRKLEEICLAVLLETRLSKEQIFELYANEVYLGQHGSFAIYGFGEASSAYFNKDIANLTLPEAALLAGLIRGPNLYLPYKYPERAIERRDFVLRRMAETGFIKPADALSATAAPLELAQPSLEAGQEPFFVDMVKEQLLTQFSERDLLSQGYKVYTTLDLDLQKAADDGARTGLVELDHLVKNQKHAKKTSPPDRNPPQLALVALDPHTGDLKALVGGRNYAASQLNHALAYRQPGSSFKPFVYAAALNSAVDGSVPTITPATILSDQPTAFKFGNQWDKPYQPRNYKQSYHGSVTVREALMYSLNVPAVQLAESIGFDKVRNLALAAGFNSRLRPTPSIALGAYEATPVEIAGAYTIFANEGQYVAPRCIVEVDDALGRSLWSNPAESRRVLDPRVSYLMVSLLQSVISGGTGAGVRARGFKLPAAGKTGTSRDGWFAGFTSNLLAVAWVGYDDNRELNLIGAHSALPLWTEFMKRATSQPSYRDAQPFKVPDGVVTASIDTATNLLASAGSTSIRKEIFIEGTEPTPPAPAEEPTIVAAVQGEDAASQAAGSTEAQPTAASEILNRILQSDDRHAAPVAAGIASPSPRGTRPSAVIPSSRSLDGALPDEVGQPTGLDEQQDPSQTPSGTSDKKFIKVFEGQGSSIQVHLQPRTTR